MVLAYTTHQFVRRLSRRFLAILAAVAILVVADQAALQPLQQQSGSLAPSVNLASRQRMLTERLTSNVLAVASGFDTRDSSDQRHEIQEAIEALMNEHVTLQHRYRVPEVSADLRQQWVAMEPHYEGMAYATAQALQTLPADASNTDSAPERSDLLIASAQLLLTHAQQALPMMDRTALLLKENADIIRTRLQLAQLAIGAMILICVASMGWLVFRPASKCIRQQVKDMDSNVRERTRELNSAFKALRLEVSQRESVQQKNKHLATQLVHADHAMTIAHLTAGIAEELRAPLSRITESTEKSEKLLKQPTRGDAISQVRELLNNAKKAAQGITHTLRRLSSISGHHQGQLESIDLHKLIYEVAELMRTELTESQTSLQLQLVASSRTIHADPIRIQQVLVNLLNNSIQAICENNRTQRTITIRTIDGEDQTATAVAHTTNGKTQNVLRVINAVNPADRKVRLEILDSGPGFPEDKIETAFSAFEGESIGLGLAICRSIVEDHHGNISIAQGEHRGAHIVVTLPTVEMPATAPTPDSVCC